MRANKCVKCGKFKSPMTFIAGCTYCPKCYVELTDEEAFFKDAREMAEGLSKEQLIGYYMAELKTCCECEEKLKVSEKTNTKIMNYAVDLEKQLAEMNKKALALFGVLYEILEKEDPDNVSSKIDYLTKQNNSTISDAYKTEKFLKGIKNE